MSRIFPASYAYCTQLEEFTFVFFFFFHMKTKCIYFSFLPNQFYSSPAIDFYSKNVQGLHIFLVIYFLEQNVAKLAESIMDM